MPTAATVGSRFLLARTERNQHAQYLIGKLAQQVQRPRAPQGRLKRSKAAPSPPIEEARQSAITLVAAPKLQASRHPCREGLVWREP